MEKDELQEDKSSDENEMHGGEATMTEETENREKGMKDEKMDRNNEDNNKQE